MKSNKANRQSEGKRKKKVEMTEMRKKIKVDDRGLSSSPVLTSDSYAGHLQVKKDDSEIPNLLSLCSVPISEIIQVGKVPLLVKFLESEDNSELKLEATRVMRYITSGTEEQIQTVIDHGAVPVLIKLLKDEDITIREQVVWALGNIAVSSTQCRDIVLGHGVLDSLLAQFDEDANSSSLLQYATRALSNLCKGSSQLSYEQWKKILPIVARIFQRSTHEEVLSNACGMLTSVIESSKWNISQSIIEADVCTKLVKFLLNSSSLVAHSALCTLGNLVKGSNKLAQVLVDCRVLVPLSILLKRGVDTDIGVKICWIISKITAGAECQIMAVICVGFVNHLDRLMKEAELPVKKEAAQALYNIACFGAPQQVGFIMRQGCIRRFCRLLSCPDQDIVLICLGALLKMVHVEEEQNRELAAEDAIIGIQFTTEDVNIAVQLIREAKAKRKVKKLMSSENNEVSQKASELLGIVWK